MRIALVLIAALTLTACGGYVTQSQAVAACTTAVDEAIAAERVHVPADLRAQWINKCASVS